MKRISRMKLITLLLTISMLSLAACGGGESAEDTAAAVLEAADSESGSEPEGIVESEDGAESEDDAESEGEDGEPAAGDAGVTETAVSADEQAVLDAYDAFGEAVVNSDADGALELVTPSTIGWGEEVLEQTLNSTGSELVETMPFSRATVVVLMRGALGEERILAATDSVDLLRGASDAAVLAGMMSLVGLGDIQIEGDEALSLDSEGVPRLRFERSADGSSWLIDLGYSIDQLLAEDEEESSVRGLTGNVDATRVDFFDALLSGYGLTFDEVSAPLK